MFSNQSAEVSLDVPCRTVAAVRGDRLDNKFLVGSCSLEHNHTNNGADENFDASSTATNVLHWISFHSEVNELSLDACLRHATGPVASLETSPIDPTLVLTAAEQSSVVNLWKIPKQVLDASDIGSGSGTRLRTFSYDSDTGGGENGGNPLDPHRPEHAAAAAASAAASTIFSMEQCVTLSHNNNDDENGNNRRWESYICDIAWRDSTNDYSSSSSSSGMTGDVLTLDRGGCLKLWDLSLGDSSSDNNTTPLRSIETSILLSKHHSGGTSWSPPKVKWDPHAANGTAVAVSAGKRVHILDWRLDASVPTGTVECFTASRRAGSVTDLDYNPNKPYLLATAGQDGMIQFWDLRRMSSSSLSSSLSSNHRYAPHPLLTARGGHSHWITTVQYNPFHDQLVLSTGTDGLVNLWRMSTISSAPLLTLQPSMEPTAQAQQQQQAQAQQSGNNTHSANNSSVVDHKDHGSIVSDDASNTSAAESSSSSPNVRVCQEELPDSVYGAAWAAADAWIYMTVSANGKAVLHHVPSKEKYKILL